MGADRLILVGRVAGAFGVRGELRLTTYTEEPLALLRYRELKREDGSPALTLTSARAAKDSIIVRAREVETRDQAEAARGLRLYVPRSTLPPPDDEDDFYQADLIGLLAVSPEGDPIGRVKAIHDFGAGDLLEIDPADGSPTWLVPFTRDAVPHVRVNEGRLTVVRPVETGEPEPEQD